MLAPTTVVQTRSKTGGHKEVSVLLYHGSKSGIVGPIAPISRVRCDFGRGFYMGTEREQPLTLICNYHTPVLYEVDLDVAGLKTVTLGANIDWALFVAYNRGKLESVYDTDLYRRVSSLADGVDVICGPIANDRMFVVLERFFTGDITDVALVWSLSALRLDSQFVAKTEKACRAISIVDKREFHVSELEELRALAEANRTRGIAQAEVICRQHRRDGRYFDEILQDGEW